MTEPSQIVGNYEFLGIVDRPKAGVTYKVRNLTTGQLEVLRMLPGASYEDPEAMARLLREIRVHARLSHPNIVAFHDTPELDGNLVMTAEFVEGTTLGELVRPGPLLSNEAARIVCDVLSGLEEAHSLGIVHRGITAEHVTVTPEGGVKLGGFGLAKPEADVMLTKNGAVLSDVRYTSPEQVMGDCVLDPRSDIYSVGVLLYQALTGKTPFDGANDFDIMAAQVGKEPRRPSSLNPGISPELERVVLTALAKDPAKRYAGAGAFRTALAAAVAVAKPEALEADRPAAPSFSPQFLTEAPRTSRTRWLLGILGFAGLIILVLLAVHAV
jgi:serine/threonine-protein kinase